MTALMTQYTKNPDVIATLSPEEFYVTQESGTERPGTGKLLGKAGKIAKQLLRCHIAGKLPPFLYLGNSVFVFLL